MADVAFLNNPPATQVAAGKGFKEKWCTYTWPGAGATATLAVPGFSVIELVIPGFAAAPATDETPYWGDTLNASGVFVVPASGKVTIGRTGAAPTNNIKGTALIRGY